MAFKKEFVETLFLSVCIVAFSSNSAHSQLTRSDLEVIQWFDQLSFPNLEKTKCVRVATGNWSRSGNEQPQNTFITAFLLSEQKELFTVFTSDLFTRTYTKTRPGTPAHEVVAFEVRDLAKEAVDQLSQLTSPESIKNARNRFGALVSERVEVFALARVCAAQKLDAVAHQLIEFAATLPTKKGSFEESLADEIGHAMMWRAVLDFGDPTIPRTALLTTFLNFCDRFPNSEHALRANDTVDILEEMLDEEKLRPKPKPPTEMTKQERIAELIFELRNQNGQQLDQPGWCDIFQDPRGEESPAAQLRKIGYDAIPQLIEAMEDHRFTRSVGYHRDFYFSHTVLRVGECAEAIIVSIAQRSFRDREKNNSEQEVRLWWDEFQKKGEEQVLIESVSRGDDNAPYQGMLLVEKYPEAAFEALRAGVLASKDDWTRTRLIELVSGLRDDSVVDFLLDEMKNAPGISTRVSAARGLRLRNREEPILSMSEEWKRTLLRGNAVNGEELVEFLANCGSAVAIHSLGFKLANRSIDLRLQVVRALGETEDWSHRFRLESEVLIPGQEKPKEPIPEVEAAVEELLVTALADRDARLGMSCNVGDIYCYDPRICDMAAYSLSKRFKNKYPFDFSVPLHERDGQILKLQNTWRSSK